MPSYQVGSNAEVVIALASGDVTITASRSGTTVTKSAGRDFSPADVGLTIDWSGATATDTISAYISPTQVTVAGSGGTVASESATLGVETTMGFRLARDEKGRVQYRAYDDAPRLLVQQVQAAGFQIDPATLEMTFEKSAWDGPFGAYTEKPGSNRPAFGIDIDYKRKTPTLAPKRYTAAGVRIPSSGTSTAISFVAPNAINGTGLFGELAAGDHITVTNPAGEAANSGSFIVATADANSVTVTVGTIVTDSTADPISIQMDFEGAVVSGVEFGGGHYICDNKKVYKMVSPANAWDTTPGTAYFKTVFDYDRAITASKAGTTITKTAGDDFTAADEGATIVWDQPNGTTDTIQAGGYISATQVTVAASATINSQRATVTYGATLEQLAVHNGYIFVLAGAARYCYSASGAINAWTRSTLAASGAGSYAHRFVVVKGILHKMYKANEHYQMSAVTEEPINGGTAWTGPDYIGDTRANIVELLGLQNNVVFCREDSVISMDGNGNISDLFPELRQYTFTSNGLYSAVWNSNTLFYVMATADIYMLRGGEPRVQMTPNLQVERPMEQISSEAVNFSGRIYGLTGIPQYLFAVMAPGGSSPRLLMLENDPRQGLIWRTLTDYTSSNNGVLWSTAISTTGPVLWAQMSDPYKPSYWILPLAAGSLQDSRSRYATPGYIYEPWLDFGCPDVEKLWSRIEVICKGTSATLAAMTVTGYNAAGTSILSKTPTMGTAPTYSDNAFTADSAGAYITRRCRLLWTFSNTDASHTPELLFYRIRARALPTPRRVWEFIVDIPQIAVTHGMAAQEQARAFLHAIRSSRRPMTFTDIFGIDWTVIPYAEHPGETASANRVSRWDETYVIRLAEVTSGV